MDMTQAAKQMDALNQQTYGIAKIRLPRGASRPLKVEDFLTPAEVTSKQKRYDIDIQNGENLYIRAVPTIDHEVIFIDDSRPDADNYLRNMDIIPACVVKTSNRDDGTSSLHCWYLMPQKLDCPTRKAVEYVIISKLHNKFPHPDKKRMPGDFGSNDGQHLGRLAGTWNFGLGRERDNPVELLEASGHVLSDAVAAQLLEEAAPFIDRIPKTKAPASELSEIDNHSYDNPKIVRYFLENVVPKMDSRKDHYMQDAFAATYLLNAKFSTMDVKKVLLEHDPNPVRDRKQGHEADYLERTIADALKKTGKTRSTHPRPDLHHQPQPQGAGCGDAFAGGVPAASAPTSSRLKLNPAPKEPDVEADSYAPPVMPVDGGKTGRRLRGTISPTGKIAFDVSLDLCSPAATGTGPLDRMDKMDNALAGTIGPKL